jgi:adenine deaminase
MHAEERRALMAVARGDVPADLILRGGRVVNVYSGEVLEGDVAVYGGRIAFVGDTRRLRAKEIKEVGGRYLVPGLIEPHAHPWILYNPRSYAEALLARGVTTAVADDLPLRAGYGEDGLGRAFAALSQLPLRYYWLLRVGFYGPMDLGQEGPGEGILQLSEVARSLQLPAVLGIAELNRWLSILPAPEEIVGLFAHARAKGLIVQGHTSGASAAHLNVLTLSGIDSCHEAITADEVLTRLRLGLYTMLRHSSLRPDLPQLLGALLGDVDTSRVMLTTDGSSPAHIAREGHVDGMVERLIAAGIPPVRAIQMATRNPAAYLGLDGEIGGIAPGRHADLAVLEELERFRPVEVYAGGRLVAAEGSLIAQLPEIEWAAIGDVAGYEDLLLPWADEVTAISFYNSVLTRRLDLRLARRGKSVDVRSEPDLLYAALVARDGSFIARGLVKGLLQDVEGFATSYTINGHLLALGRSPDDMLLALRTVAERGGGFAHVTGGDLRWFLPLEVLGGMRAGSFADAVLASRELESFARSHGYAFEDPAYSLHFLEGDFLPGPRLTARGVVDAKTGAVIYPAVRR